MLKYSLFPNKLTGNNDFRAVMQERNPLSIEDLADQIVKPGSTVTKAEFLAMNEEFFLAVLQVLHSGGAVNSPLFNIKLGITGVFTSEDDGFDASRHEVIINLSPGVRLKNEFGKVDLEKVPAVSPQAQLKTLYDYVSDTTNITLTSGGTARITGQGLKVDLSDVTQGIFFVKVGTGEEVKVTRVVDNLPKELGFMVPANLSTGTWRVEVRNKPGDVLELRKGHLNADLLVS
jgi:hypothetical protein